jgi:hypothetical protein
MSRTGLQSNTCDPHAQLRVIGLIRKQYDPLSADRERVALPFPKPEGRTLRPRLDAARGRNRHRPHLENAQVRF